VTRRLAPAIFLHGPLLPTFPPRCFCMPWSRPSPIALAITRASAPCFAASESTAAGGVTLRQPGTISARHDTNMRTDRNCHGLGQRRPCTTSYAASIASVVYLHTETLNIWSHLLGAVWFCSSAVRFATAGSGSPPSDAVAALLYLTATALCFASSTLYHTFADHAHADVWQLIDHVGIIGNIWASSVAFTLLSFPCQSVERWMFVALVSSAAALCLCRLLRIHPHDPCARQMRLCAHIALGALAALPALRTWLQRSQDKPTALLEKFAWLVLANSAGGGIYASHLLDKAVGMDWGLPDLSHHVMHVMVVAGALVYAQGISSRYHESAGLTSSCTLMKE
jgi:adiponectin receptor